MAKFSEVLEFHTTVFVNIPRVSDDIPHDPRDDAHLPNVPPGFIRKTTYQRGHSTKRWFRMVTIKLNRTRSQPKRFHFAATLTSTPGESVGEMVEEEVAATPQEEVGLTPMRISKLSLSSDDEESLSEDLDASDEEEEPDQTTKTYTSAQIYYKNLTETLGVHRLSAVHRQMSTYHMDLHHVSMTAADFKAVCVSLMMCHLVTRINLTDCMLDDAKVNLLCELLGEVSSITDLILRHNQLGIRQIKRLINNLRDRDYIQYLDLSGNGLRNDSALYICRYIEGSSSLTHLLLSQNSFTEDSAKFFGAVIASNHYLRCLDLSWNKILRRDGSKLFFKGLAKNHDLESLDISWNFMRDAGVQWLKRMLWDNCDLRHISLVGTGITGEGLKTLLAGLQKNEGVESIKLFHNPILIDDYSWFLTGILQLENTAIMNIDLTGMSLNEEDTSIIEELNKKMIEVTFSGTTGAQEKKTDAFSLKNKMLKAKKVIVLEDTMTDIQNLKPQYKDKLAMYFLEMDENDAAQEPSLYLKSVFDGFISTRAVARRVLLYDPDIEVPDLVKKLEGYTEPHNRKIHVVSSIDPMNFYLFRNNELKGDLARQIEALTQRVSHSQSSRHVSFPK